MKRRTSDDLNTVTFENCNSTLFSTKKLCINIPESINNSSSASTITSASSSSTSSLLLTTNCTSLSSDLTLKLPDEIILKICKYLDGNSVLLLSKINKRYRLICMDKELWEQIYINDFGNINIKSPIYRPIENLSEWTQPGEYHYCWSGCNRPGKHLSRSTIMFQSILDDNGIDIREKLIKNGKTKNYGKWLRTNNIKNNWLNDKKTNINNNNIITCISIITSFDFKKYICFYGTMKGAIGCYSTIDGSKLFYFNNVHSEAIWTITLTDNEKYGFAGSGDKLISCWDINNKNILRYILVHTHAVRCLKIYNNELFSICGQSGIVRTPISNIVDPNNNNNNNNFKTWNLPVQGIRIIEIHDDLLFVGTGKGTLSIYDLKQSTKLIATFHRHQEKILCIAYKSEQRLLATGGIDGQVVIYSLNDTGGDVLETFHHPDPITHLLFTDKNIIAGSSKGKIYIQSYFGSIFHQFDVHTAGITGLYINVFGHLISSSNDGTIVLFDMNTKKHARYLWKIHPQHNIWQSGISDTQLVFIYRNEHGRNQIATIDYDWPNP